MEDVEIVERLTAVEERSKSNTKRLDKLEDVVDSIHTMSLAIQKMGMSIETMDKTLTTLSGKVDAQERIPADNWKGATNQLKNAIFSAVGALISAGLIWVLLQVAK